MSSRYLTPLLFLMTPAIVWAQPAATAQAPASIAWVHTQGEDLVLAVRDSRIIGSWKISEQKYYLPDGSSSQPPEPVPARYLRPSPPPSPTPDPNPSRPVREPNHGVDREKIRSGHTSINGRECSKSEAQDAIAKGLPDDRNLLRLTIIGPEAQRKLVLQDLESSPLLLPWKGKLLVQDYDPGHWAVKDAGFQVNGVPTIYIQTQDGVVKHRQQEYQGGTEGLAKALRKADPNYNPEKDMDLRKDPLPGANIIKWLSELPTWVWILAAVLLYLYLRREPSSVQANQGE